MKFQVLTILRMSVLFFWVVTPFWRQYVSPKCWYLHTSPHGVKTQKTNIDERLHVCTSYSIEVFSYIPYIHV
jgi:hypothetical protein